MGETIIQKQKNVPGHTETARRLEGFLKYEFSINMKEEADFYIRRMEEINASGEDLSALSSLNNKLLEILRNVPEYMRDHRELTVGGKIKIASLMETFDDCEKNAEAIEEYKKYVSKLKSVSELDSLFRERIKKIYSFFHSSDEYMSRMVTELLEEYNEKIQNEGEKYDLTQPVRLLILKHFIRQFGYCDEVSYNKSLFSSEDEEKKFEKYFLEKFNNEKLKEYVENKCGGDYMKLTDNVFSALEKGDFSDYANKVAKLIGNIKYKANLIMVSPKLCEKICALISDDYLSERAKDRTAVYLSDCFNKDFYEIDLNWIKDFGNTELSDETESLYKELVQGFSKSRELKDFSLSQRLFSLVKNHAHEIDYLPKYRSVLISIYREALRPFKHAKTLDRVIGKDALKRSDLISSLPEDIVSVFITDDERLEIIVDKICYSLPENPELLKVFSKIYGETVINPNKVTVKASLGKSLFGSVIKETKLKEGPKRELITAVEKEFLRKNEIDVEEKLSKENYLFLLLNCYGSYFAISDLSDKTFEIFNNFLEDNRRKMTLFDAFDPDKLKFVDFEESKELKKMVLTFEKKVLENKSEAEREEYLREISELVFKGGSDVKITYKNHKELIRVIAILTGGFASKIPAEKELVELMKLALKKWNLDFSKETKVKSLADIVAPCKRKIEKLRGNELPDSEEEKQALSRFVEKAESLISDKESYMKKLNSIVIKRYTDAVATNKNSLYQAVLNKLKKSGLEKERNTFFDSEKGFEFLKIADSLASSKFSSQTESFRENLYLFAIAFEMTFVKAEKEKKDSDRKDIEKNLFFDYYCDNFAKKSDEMLKHHKKYVSGKAINYKNFAEITVLWFLAKEREEMTAKEKLVGAYSVIYSSSVSESETEITDEVPFEKTGAETKSNVLTPQFEEDFITQVLSKKTPQMLKAHLTEKYNCSRANGPFGADSKNRRAEIIYRKLLSDVNSLLKDVIEKRLFESDTDVEEKDNIKNFFESLYLADIDFSKEDQELQKIIRLISERLEKSIKNEEIVYVDSSRTSIIILCYFYMILLNFKNRETDSTKKIENISFKIFLKRFCKGRKMVISEVDETTLEKISKTIIFEGTDKLLEEAGYQPVNLKNIFDTYIVFLAYRDSLIPYYSEIKESDYNKKTKNNISKKGI